MIAAAMAAMVAELDAAGVRAVADPVAVDPPCAFVDLPALDTPTAGGAFLAAMRVHLIAPGGVGTVDAVAAIDAMLSRIVAAGLDVVDARPGTITLGATDTPAPVYTLTLERTTE